MNAKKKSPAGEQGVNVSLARGKVEPEVQHEDTHFRRQRQIIHAAWLGRVATMKMISLLTGIDRSNICAYVKELRLRGLIKQVKIDKCKITKHTAVYYTTLPAECSQV